MATLLERIISIIKEIFLISRLKVIGTGSEETRLDSSSTDDPKKSLMIQDLREPFLPMSITSQDGKNGSILHKGTLSILENEIRGLRLATFRGHKLRYKPLLLLAVCHLIDSGEISENKIFMNFHLQELFRQLIESVGYRKTVNIGLPFYHLRTSIFWCHKINPGKKQIYDGNPNLGKSWSKLNEIIEYAYIHPDFLQLFFQEDSRKKIHQIILESYFTETDRNNIRIVFGDRPQQEMSEEFPELQFKQDQDKIGIQSSVDKLPDLDQLQTEMPSTSKLSKEQIETNSIYTSNSEDLLQPDERSKEIEDDKKSLQFIKQERTRKIEEISQTSSLPSANLLSIEKPTTERPQLEKKRRKFYFDVHPFPDKDPKSITEFLKRGERGTLFDMVGIDPNKIEGFLLTIFKDYAFIGELPFSKLTFDYFCEVIQRNYIIGEKREIKQVPPALFITSMVFCARYSEEEAKRFWQPFASLVWQTELTQYFQTVCRKHYLHSRDFLLEHFDLVFPALTAGGVVRPIYYQAVIPYYLQSTFAQWLISNFEQILKFSAEDLPSVLQKDKSLEYMPAGLKSFVTRTETLEAATKLIKQLANAIKLFQTTEQFEAVDSIMDSPIERSLWKEIYQDLIKEGIELGKVRSYTAKLGWIWDMEAMDLGLQLSHVRSQISEKPNLIVWAGEDNLELIKEDNIFDVHPWRLENGDWELETEIIYELGELNGKVFVLSEQYDLEEPIPDQRQHIILQKSIPDFSEDHFFFFIPSKGQIARSKERINVNGKWIIFSKDKLKIHGQGNQGATLIDLDIHIPDILRNAGFKFAEYYQLELPVEIQTVSGNIGFDQPGSVYIFEADVVGEKWVDQISPRVQSIFTSNEIGIRTFANFPTKNFQRIWVSIYRGNKFLQSISLDELQQQDLLSDKEDHFFIGLFPYIDEPGLYSINILHNLRDLLEVPLKFGYLPNLNIVGPDPTKCFSPENPATIQIEGVPKNHIVLPEVERAKIERTPKGIRLVMREMRRSEARFSLQWEGNNIQVCYDIERVTAWIDGMGDKANIIENQTEDLVLHVRGIPYERFNWVENGHHFRRDFYLNAKGEFDGDLEKSALRDILRQSKFIETEMGIKIREHRWRLFTYTKSPKITIKDVKYQNRKISIVLEQANPLSGSYSFQVRSATNPIQQFVIGSENRLQKQHTYKVFLEPDLYTLELVNLDQVIARSNDFKVSEEKAQVHPTTLKQFYIPISRKFTAGEIYESLSAPPSAFRELRNKNTENLLPILKQLMKVNDTSTWINPSGKYDENFKQLLPTWAVIAHPLQVITKNPRKIMHLFPQKAVYGGKYGKGFVKAKFVDGPINLYAAWTTDLKTNRSRLWLMVPQEENVTRFCDMDEHNLWPCYRCVDCGTIVGSRVGNRVKLPPKTIFLHTHKNQLPLDQQFIDTVYTRNIKANITQYKNDLLFQIDTPSNVFDNEFFFDLLEGKQEIETGEMEKPINLDTSQDYNLAVSEVVSNYSETIHEFNLKQILGKRDLFKNIETKLSELSSEVQAFNAFFRLYQRFNVRNALAYLPKHILLLAVLLRFKAHHTKDYKSVIHHMHTDEKEIVRLIYLAMSSCPKLFEWSIFWSEVFFHHTAS